VVERLSARQREIVALVAAGWSDKRIARRLCLTPATVKNHLYQIREHLGGEVRRMDNQRVALAVWWARQGAATDPESEG